MLVFSFLLGLIVNNAWGLDYWLSTKKTTDFLFPNLEYSKRQLRIIPEPYEYTTSNYPPLLVNKTTVLHIDYRLPQYFVKLLNQEFTDLFKDSLTCVLDSFKSYTPLFLINNTYAKNTKGYFDFFSNYLTPHHTDNQTKIILRLNINKLDDDESYSIISKSNNEIYINGSVTGIFYGTRTLLQILHQNYSAFTTSSFFPITEIIDKPKFSYRGLHLDVARHFFSVAEIKHILKLMAMYKLNKFHWHLTDDQGWRIEIKKLPNLTNVGALRNSTPVVKGIVRGRKQYIQNNKPYQGFYTQEDVKDIVNYAAQLNIEIIPEIDIPGHAQAMIAAYPFLSCNDTIVPVATTWIGDKVVLCAGKESTYETLKIIFDEIKTLFPSSYLHIGQDEAKVLQWKKCTHCKAVMEKYKLKKMFQLQEYFMNRVSHLLYNIDKTPAMWDDLVSKNANINKTTLVYNWKSDKNTTRLIKNNQPVIITLRNKFYLDYYQSVNTTLQPYAFPSINSLKEIYLYNVPKSNNIIGVQACVWTEYISDLKHLEYMIMPRIIALSEIAWTMPHKKQFKNFKNKLFAESKFWDRQNISYSRHFIHE